MHNQINATVTLLSLVTYRQNLEQNDQDFAISDLSRLSGLGHQKFSLRQRLGSVISTTLSILLIATVTFIISSYAQFQWAQHVGENDIKTTVATVDELP